MSLTRTLARMVAERGEASADDLLPLLEGYTRRQVIRGMQNAASMGLVEAARHNCGGQGKGRTPSTYRVATPKPKPAPRQRAASVWEYAQL